MENQELEKIILSAGVCEDIDMHKKALLQMKDDSVIDEFNVYMSIVNLNLYSDVYLAVYSSTINGLVKVNSNDILAQDYLFVVKCDVVQLCWRVERPNDDDTFEKEHWVKCAAVKYFKGSNAIQNAIKYMCGDFIESAYRESLIDLAYKSGKLTGGQSLEPNMEYDEDMFDFDDSDDDIMI